LRFCVQSTRPLLFASHLSSQLAGSAGFRGRRLTASRLPVKLTAWRSHVNGNKGSSHEAVWGSVRIRARRGLLDFGLQRLWQYVSVAYWGQTQLSVSLECQRGRRHLHDESFWRGLCGEDRGAVERQDDPHHCHH